MHRLQQLALLLLVLGTPVYQWAHPELIPFDGKPFSPSQLDAFRQAEREQESLRRDTQAVSDVFDRAGCDAEGLAFNVALVARQYKVSPRLVAAQIFTESSCRPDAVSDKGAVGLLQVMPKIWGIPRRELLDPDRNLREGTKILASYIRQSGSVRDGLRHYYGITSDSTESDEYADKVLLRATRRP